MKKPILILLAFAMVLVAFTESTFKKNLPNNQLEKLKISLVADEDFRFLVVNAKEELRVASQIFKENILEKGRKANKNEKANIIKATAKNEVLAKVRKIRIELVTRFPELAKLTKEEFKTIFKEAAQMLKRNIELAKGKVEVKNDSLRAICIANCDGTFYSGIAETEMNFESELAWIEFQYDTCVQWCTTDQCFLTCQAIRSIDENEATEQNTSESNQLYNIWESCLGGCEAL